MTWQQRLNAALHYIEANLDQKLELETVAAQACCSHFHFMRMFEVVSGVSAGDYIRRRRLSQAALALASGKEKVIDVALRYGYDTPEAFAKAFKRLFGITPSEACRPGARLVAFPPLTVSIVLKGTQSMQYRIVEQAAPIPVAGVGIRVSKAHQQQAKAIPRFWQSCARQGIVRAFDRHGGRLGLLGICCEWEAATEEFTYLIAIEQPAAGTALPEATRRLDLPAGSYAAFAIQGTMPDAIQQGWQRIYTEWFPNSGYEHAGSPDFERYPRFPVDDPRGDPASPHCTTEIWVPLKQARA